MNKGEINRETNFDLLRIIATIAVIIVHISAVFKNGITDLNVFGYLYTEHIPTIILYDTILRFSVPCFVMISGAFLLANEKNADYKYFYKKSLKSIGVYTAIFSVLYVLYDELLIIKRGSNLRDLIIPIKSLIKGVPYYHMWYLYTLLIIYMFVPVIIRIKRDIDSKVFGQVSWIILIITSISGWTSTFTLNWSISKAICFVGYLLIGYQIRIYYLNKKSNIKAMLYLIAGCVVGLILSYIQYQHSINGLAEYDEKYSLVDIFNPLIVVMSVLIFAAFSQMKIKTDKLRKLASDTFVIYLFHGGVITVLNPIMKKIDAGGLDCRIIIPAYAVIVFIISLLLARIYKAMFVSKKPFRLRKQNMGDI